MRKLFSKKLGALLLGASLLMGSQAVAAEKKGGTLVGPVVTTSMVRNFNPYTQNVNRSPAPGLMYEPLLVYNFRQNKIEYRLATAFEYSDDLMSITYTIRDGAKWSDGNPFTADDVVFTFDMAKKFPAVDIAGLFVGENPKVKSVEKVGDNQVRFNLTKVNTTIEWFIPDQLIVPKHIWEKVDDPSTFKNENPVGSGPLTHVKRAQPQQQVICRNPHYWEAGKPNIDCVRLRQFQSNDQVQAALIRGEIDWGSNFIPDIEKTFVAKDPANHHFWYPAGSSVNIHLNTAKKPFDDIAVRQAFSMALDRPSIVELATYGYASENPHVTGFGDFFAQWYDDGVNAKYDYLNKYDPAAANKLLDDAGYKDTDGDGYRENKDGSPISFNIMVVNGWTDWVQSVQMTTEFLKDIGIRGKTRTVEWGQYVENWKGQKFDAGILWGDTGVTPYRFFEPMLHTRNAGQSFQANHGMTDPAYDKLLDDYAATVDPAKHREIINKLQEAVASNLMVIPVFSNPTWYQYSTKRFVGWPSAENPFINPNFYHPGERVMMVNALSKK